MKISEFLPLPDLEKCASLLCVQPHPDDNEVGAGATIAKLVKSGCRVTYLTITDGRIGTSEREADPNEIRLIRRKEAEESARLLGVSSTIFLDYEDAGYTDARELCRRIVSVIRDVQPEMVMSTDPFLPYEAHPDHRAAGMAAAEAVLFSSFPHFYSYGAVATSKTWPVKGVAFYNTAYPNTFIDVDATWELKIGSIAVHQSQFSPELLGILRYYFEFKARKYAEGKTCTYAEAFKVLTPMHLHSNVDTINL